jgi:Tol biopolymer transport system component
MADWSPDGRQIIVPLNTQLRGISILDVASRKKTEFFSDRQYALIPGPFSPDGHWISLVKPVRADSSQIFIVPIREGKPSRTADWLAITDGSAQDTKPAWSPLGNLLFFLSTRDGSLCIWAQGLHPGTKRPSGAPFAAYHSHDEPSIIRAGASSVDLAVGGKKLVFGQGEIIGSVWTHRLR